MWQFNPYAIPLFMGSVPVAAFALVAWRHRTNQAAGFFLAFLIAVIGLMLTYGFELLSAALPLMMIWLRFEYIFTLSIPVLWLLFMLAYSGHKTWLTPGRIALLFVVPAVHLFTVWTNPYHGLNWSRVGTITINNLVLFDRSYGPMFYIGTAYLYLVGLAATIIMIAWVQRSRDLYRGQIAALILATIFFWAGSLLTIAGLTIVPKLDLTPFGAALTAVPIAWSLFRYKLLDVLPAARGAVIQGMKDAVIVLDARSRVIELNPAAEALTGAQAARAIGQPASAVLGSVPELVERYKDVHEAQGELEIGEGAGRQYFDLRISPLYNRDNELNGRIVVLRDVTRLKLAEQAAQRNAAELAERNAELDAFGHTIAHDLKAPIAVIMGYADIMLEFDRDRMPPRTLDYIQGIQRSAVKMETMVSELLQLASVRDVGAVVNTVVMTPVAQAAVERFRPDIEKRGIRVEIAPEMPPALGHPLWLEEVFANLISNAVKYIGKDNPSPSITIRGLAQGDCARYEVRDNGLGIKPEDQAQLFEMFARFHKGEASGLGLGLSIALRIIKRLNGQIGVESAPGQGSTFWFSLPAPGAAPKPAAAVPVEKAPVALF